jgi:hypothetical protein
MRRLLMSVEGTKSSLVLTKTYEEVPSALPVYGRRQEKLLE